MLERFVPAIRVLCLILAGIAALQAAQLATRSRSRPEWSAGDSLLTSGPAAMSPASPQGSQTSQSPAASTNAAAGTNAVSPGRSAAARRGGGPPNPNLDLPLEVQARIERITQSEIFGAMPRPQPLTLLGIAGRDVILRTPDGRTGLVRLGEEFGGVKLLQVGTNRVLVEHEQQRKELTLFSGFGGEPLLRNETKKIP